MNALDHESLATLLWHHWLMCALVWLALENFAMTARGRA